MKIFGKILSLLLAISVIPLLIVGYLAIRDAKLIGTTAMTNSEKLGATISADSQDAMKALGEATIQQKAEDVAKELSIYVKMNPTLGPEELQNDPYFKSLAVQGVGRTGYTAAAEIGTLLSRWHPSPTMIGITYYAIESKVPDLVKILDTVNKTGINGGGYYKWKEADGSIRDKYLYAALVPDVKANGVGLAVAATTYIDEFYQPVNAMKDKISASTVDTKNIIKGITDKMTTQNIIIFVIVLIIALIVGYIAARSISAPIIKLKKAADEITQGNLNVTLPATKGSDEIAELTGSMEMLLAAIKSKK